MDHHSYNNRSRGLSAWTVIGYISFGILGLLMGAALLYGLFFLFLMPAEETLVEPEAEERPEEPGPPLPERSREMVEVVEQVMPAVVGVSSHFDVTGFGGRQFGQRESGSGVVIAPDGYIVTNHHVIENAREIKVHIPNQGLYDAELIGSDTMTDLALLRIDEGDLTYVPFADSQESRVGETVLAIGNPLGLQQTVTAGIISAVERQVMIPGTDYAYTFIQTDAVVNPGNSGGPLVNLDGAIVGINTAKIVLPGVEGIGLSIPSNTVNRVISDFKEHGKVLRPYMGVLLDDWLNYDDPEPDMGVIMVEIVPGSPADQAGLAPGDIIVSIDGRTIDYLAQLFDMLLYYYPGDAAAITYYRDGEATETVLTFAERPEDID